MAVVTPTPKTQFLMADGAPLVGGKVYTYAAGTTTPQATYTDSTGNVPNTNPVILDSRGEANIWLGESSYKFKLTDANNVEIWTVDNVTAPTTAVSPVLSGNVTISTNSIGTALKITQTGSGNALVVQDSADPDLTPFVITAAGFVGIGTQAPVAALDIDNSGTIQLSDGGTARTVISASATDSIIDVKDSRNFVVKTNNSTRLTISGSGATTLTGALSVDTINEYTSAAGVTVDGVVIKDSAIAGDYLRIAGKTAQASTSGTTITFSAIPTWARRITVMLSNVSTDSTSPILVRLGTSGGIVTSAYASTSARMATGTTVVADSTAGFIINHDNAGDFISGSMSIYALDNTAFIYSSDHSVKAGPLAVITGGGTITLSGLATQLDITTISGTALFDSGTINVIYE